MSLPEDRARYAEADPASLDAEELSYAWRYCQSDYAKTTDQRERAVLEEIARRWVNLHDFRQPTEAP